MSITLGAAAIAGLPGDRFLVSEFFSEELIGIIDRGADVDVGLVPRRSSRLLRIAPWSGNGPVLAGTDLSFSGGGVEIAEWCPDAETVSGRVATGWDYKCRVSVAFPRDGDCALVEATVPPGGGAFQVAI